MKVLKFFGYAVAIGTNILTFMMSMYFWFMAEYADDRNDQISMILLVVSIVLSYLIATVRDADKENSKKRKKRLQQKRRRNRYE